MKKKLLIFLLLPLLFLSCSRDIEKKEQYQALTIINETPFNLYVSVISDKTDATNAEDFYSQTHNYLVKQAALYPESDDTTRNRYIYITEKGSYDLTLYAFISTPRDEKFYIKYSFNFSGDKKITIGNGGYLY